MNENEFIQEISHEAPVVRLVDTIIHNAIGLSASDIHLEPCCDGLRIRFRIDGILHDQESIDNQFVTRLISRLKILAQLDIAEKRIAQDGKFRVVAQGAEIDLRVSTFPCMHGEKVVIRILNRSVQAITIDSLGLAQEMQFVLQDLLSKPQGFMLVCGPTGSGKTTTLYAALSCLNNKEKNIITLEDPVEYNLKGITQSQVNPEVGFSFASGMRALLRQDPDVIMVGEIRDQQTAQIAHEAALTGHMVLSTIHTNNAVSVIMRLMDMGIEPFLINACLGAVLAQRLARKICLDCRIAVPATEQQHAILRGLGFTVEQLHKGTGCTKCHGLGYKGRIGIFELLVLTNGLRALIIDNPNGEALEAQARADGMRSLMIDGAQKVASGLITFEELMRVVV